jgi:predicted DNA-binding transcriptional regulator AlpA
MSIQQGYSIPEWCKLRKVCRATYYIQKKRGKVPRSIKIGNRRIITAEEDAEWVREQTAETEAADAIARAADADKHAASM